MLQAKRTEVERAEHTRVSAWRSQRKIPWKEKCPRVPHNDTPGGRQWNRDSACNQLDMLDKRLSAHTWFLHVNYS